MENYTADESRGEWGRQEAQAPQRPLPRHPLKIQDTPGPQVQHPQRPPSSAPSCPNYCFPSSGEPPATLDPTATRSGASGFLLSLCSCRRLAPHNLILSPAPPPCYPRPYNPPFPPEI